jgi:hypothetical protein
MKTKLGLVLMLIAVALILMVVWANYYLHVVKQRSGAGHDALRRAAEFLQPDTRSDLRFGKYSPPHATP